MDAKYGEISTTQVDSLKKTIQKSIFFLLLYVDPKTKGGYPDVDVNKAFSDLQNKLSGLNELLNGPVELLIVMSLLEKASLLYQTGEAEKRFMEYRKLILDAGAETMRIGRGDAND